VLQSRSASEAEAHRERRSCARRKFKAEAVVKQQTLARTVRPSRYQRSAIKSHRIDNDCPDENPGRSIFAGRLASVANRIISRV
jgi:hypothetical protein